MCNISTEYVHDLPVSSLQTWTCVFVFVSPQVDLEPEGKVFIHISLTGSFIDGKAAAIKASYHHRVPALTVGCFLGSKHTTVSKEHLRAICVRVCV